MSYRIGYTVRDVGVAFRAVRRCARGDCAQAFLGLLRGMMDQAYRAISTGQLRASPPFHTRPIDVLVLHGSRGVSVSRRVSRLDAFSGYPVRT